MELLQRTVWSPYVVGVGIGVLTWLAHLLSDKTIGCSTAYVRTSGMLERLVRGEKVLDKPYYQKHSPTVTWEWMLVIGVFVGAFISAVLSDSFRVFWVPQLWLESFGTDPVLRWLTALVGGVLMGFGARWAGGCTSGHGISGTLQLAISSWLVAICLFIGGIAAAMLLFHGLS